MQGDLPLLRLQGDQEAGARRPQVLKVLLVGQEVREAVQRVHEGESVAQALEFSFETFKCET